MNRRFFIAGVGAALAGAALDPERALWQPGRKLISIPRLTGNLFARVGDIVTFAGLPERYIVTDVRGSEITDLLFKMHPQDIVRKFPLPTQGLYLSAKLDMERW